MSKIYIFEGPDMCGKSTQLSKVFLNLKDKYSVFCMKFPSEYGTCSTEIYNMLNYDREEICNIDNIKEITVLNNINKITAISNIVKKEPKHDIYLVDRFIISSIVYDFARAYLAELIHNNVPVELSNQFSSHMNYLLISIQGYLRRIGLSLSDIRHVVFRKSNVIEDLIKTSDRKIDSTDKDIDLQSYVSDLYSCIKSIKEKGYGNDILEISDFDFKTKYKNPISGSGSNVLSEMFNILKSDSNNNAKGIVVDTDSLTDNNSENLNAVTDCIIDYINEDMKESK